MKKEREELRRGLRSFIADAGSELAEFTNGSTTPAAPPVRPKESPPRPSLEHPAPVLDRPHGPERPILPPERSLAQPERPPASPRLEAAIRPILKLVRDVPQPEAPAQPSFEEFTSYLARKGVCAAYFTNKRCWELPEAYCNQALHVCRLRECPIYDLHRDDMEKRFASKFKHLW